MVSVDEEYLAFLHDQLAENQAKLKEVLGEGGAQAVFSQCAERLVGTIEGGNYSFHPIDCVIQRMTGWGMEVKRQSNGEDVKLEVSCPHAERVHPRLTSKDPKCPLGEYVLGAIRLEDSEAFLTTNELIRDGAKLAIKTAG